MFQYLFKVILFMFLSCSHYVAGQMLQFGTCDQVETMKFFDMERFLGQWYEVSRYPTWYESSGMCAFKRIHYCNRRVKIEHVYVKDGIQYVLHVNSTYRPGDDAVFLMRSNNIDPVGTPFNVISTDYTNYAVVHGCTDNLNIGLRYVSAWILSRTPTLPEEMHRAAVLELNSVPNANVAFLESVEQTEDKCGFYWTAHVEAVNVDNEIIRK